MNPIYLRQIKLSQLKAPKVLDRINAVIVIFSGASRAKRKKAPNKALLIKSL